MSPPTAHINAIGTATPAHDVHAKFLTYVADTLPYPRDRALFRRMAARSGIAHRRSVHIPDPHPDRIDTGGFYRRDRLTMTSVRMARFAEEAPVLAKAALDDLTDRLGGSPFNGLTHLITITCTGFTAPGLDVMLLAQLGIPATVERTQIGFMGCNAAFNGLKLARHIIRSQADARVLVLNLELCTLHFQEPQTIDQALMYLLFADGAAATLVTADPQGLALERFGQGIIPDTMEEITWTIGDYGFEMYLSGEVPRHIARHLPAHVTGLLGSVPAADLDLWAVHPGGRSVLDAVQSALGLSDGQMGDSRKILNDFGNLSSASVPFILRRLLEGEYRGRRGMALGFGPGLGIESMMFGGAA